MIGEEMRCTDGDHVRQYFGLELRPCGLVEAFALAFNLLRHAKAVRKPNAQRISDTSLLAKHICHFELSGHPAGRCACEVTAAQLACLGKRSREPVPTDHAVLSGSRCTM